MDDWYHYYFPLDVYIEQLMCINHNFKSNSQNLVLVYIHRDSKFIKNNVSYNGRGWSGLIGSDGKIIQGNKRLFNDYKIPLNFA